MYLESEVTYLCIEIEVFVLTVRLLMFYNYSYVLFTINRSTLDTVISLFLEGG